jgi:Fe-S oxidoreductase
MLFTWPERAVFIALLLVSVSGFWMRFRGLWRNVTASKDDPDLTLRSISLRIRDVVLEVLLQSKVIVQRPLPGIAHALVFWGFCAFALITVNHFAVGLNTSVLDRHVLAGKFYYWFAAIFAALVAVSIAGLAFRRFVIRPRWLGNISYESGLIAFLIFFLMVTYLATFLPGGQESKPLWWAHTLTILFFLPLIPHTKHVHLVLSPFTVFTKRNGFSKIPPLGDEDDFGLKAGKDVTKLVAFQVYTCVECGRCTEHCPAYLTGKILNPKEIVLGTRRYLTEFGAGNETPLIGKYLSEEAAFQCTTCGSCEFQCPVGIQHLPLIVGLRRGVVNTGQWEDQYGTKLFLNLERNGNSLGMSLAERDKFIQKQQFPIFDGTQEYCLWLGCMGAYDPRGQETIKALVAVMRYLGVTFGVLRAERCNGDPARRLGNDLAFGELAQSNLYNLTRNKVNKIISICPHCVRTISTDWKEYGTAPPVEHHTEFLARHIDRLPRRESDSSTIVYHDPCYLGRYRNCYDEPREVASAYASQLVEPARTRERSFCCGAGGGLMFLGEEKGKRINVERAQQLIATGADAIATACPFCNSMFWDAIHSISPDPPQLFDIAQLVAGALRLPPDPIPKKNG